MTTNARPQTAESSHFYTAQGEPLYDIARSDGKGMRKFTLADARKMEPRPLPSVTTILKMLHKQALVDWMCEQTALACLTTPRNDGESLDEFVYRVLHTERVQDQESQKARDRGTEIHTALEDLFCGKPISPEIDPWVRPAFEAVCKYGELACTERILVGDGYAGKCDLIQLGKDCWWLWDWKSSKTLPTKGAYPEARLQLGAYAKAWETFTAKQDKPLPIRTGNIYISTVDCGKFVVCAHDDWKPAYVAFANIVKVWQWQNGYQC